MRLLHAVAPVLMPLVLAACSDHRAPLTSPSPMPGPTLIVRVRDAHSGAPVQGAQVVVTRPDVATRSSAPMLAGAMTDAAGTVTIDAVASGQYQVHVRRIGYSYVARTVELRGSPLAPVVLTVPAVQAPLCTLGSTRIVAPVP